MGFKLGPSFKGTYQLVPPPGANVTGFGFKRLKRGLKKVGKGVKRVGKTAVKAPLKAHRLSTKAISRLPGGKLALKAAMAPLKVGKYALKAMAKLAAKPLVMLYGKLSKRRANYLAYQRTGKAVASIQDRKAGAAYATAKFRKAGPIGSMAIKILKAVGTSGVSGDTMRKTWKQDAAMCGMTGAEIAAAVAAIMASLTALIKSLNKPGEAPENPASGQEPRAEQAEEPQGERTEEPQTEQAEEPQTEQDEG